MPALIFPDTPKPPTTIKAPVVDAVELVVLNKFTAPNTFKAEWNVDAPVTPIPPPWTSVVDANVATPDTDNVELAVTAPIDVNDVWNVEAPVIPIPPAVTNNADELVCTPDTETVDDAVRAPTDVNEVWKIEAPVTPTPPAVTKTAAA